MEIGGKTLTASFTNLAQRAQGSVMVKYGETVLLATATMSETEKEGIDFLPLTVEFEERYYALGKILGSRFMRREGKPSEKAILSGRIIDRTIRPLFDQWIRNEIQVVVTTLAVGSEDVDALGVIAASLALGTSHIPWNGPVSSVKISGGTQTPYVINPDRGHGDFPDGFEFTVCGKDGNITMIECAAREIKEDVALNALKEASLIIEKIQKFQKDIFNRIAPKKRALARPNTPQDLLDLFEKEISPIMPQTLLTKTSGDEGIQKLKTVWGDLVHTHYKDGRPENVHREAHAFLFEDRVNAFIHDQVIRNKKRVDGRGVDDIRELYAQAGGVSSVLHGSGIFFRGETHIFTALTLGSPQDTLVTEDAPQDSKGKHYIHHYNFPPFSTGETGKLGGTNRRMIGHGALAEKALIPVLPSQNDFPYTIRLVSEAFSSNGSTSMASVCGSTLALMDGGVPIKKPVAGISSGVMIESPEHFVILTDIQGPEDHYGDMDFKVAGTRDGITAIQMDIKVSGIPLSVLSVAFEKALIGRKKILDVIEKTIPAPRPHISPNAPEIVRMSIKQDQIASVIGPNGKTIRMITEKTGVDNIDVHDDGIIYITGQDGGPKRAEAIIQSLTHTYEKGEIYEGVVTKILDFGAFVKISDTTEGLVHISEIAPFRIEAIGDYLHVGDKVPVIIKEIDEKNRINLSIKERDPNFIKKA